MKTISKRIWAAVGSTATIAAIGAGIALDPSVHPSMVKADKPTTTVRYVNDATFAKGSKMAFDIYSQVPSDQDLKKLVIYDKLEPVYTHVKTRVFNGDTDITDQGKLDFDKTTNTTNWTANDPAKWFGRKLTTRVEVVLKNNANLDKYLDKNTNQYNIPNVGDMIVNDKTVPSNEVNVHTPNDKNPTVVKSIQDKDGKWGDSAKYKQGEEYHYKVLYTIPKNGSKLTNVAFSDDLEDVLSLEKVKVSDEKNNDITDTQGTLKTDKEKESFNWQAKESLLSSMQGHTYTVDITAKVKDNVGLSKYLDKASEQYQIPNTAQMSYNGKDIPSNPVQVITPPPAKNKVTKEVKGLSDSFKSDHDNVEIGKDYTYKITYEPAQGLNLKDVEFTDDLEDVLDLEKVVVQNPDGKDITDSEGTLKLDQKNESFNWQPKDDYVKTMGGKKYTVLVTAKVKSDADLQKYIKNNTIEIPNTAHFKANGEDTPSNTPVVTPKTQEPKASKGIVKNPSDWSKFFGTQSSTAASQESDSITGMNENTESDTWKNAEKYVKKDENGQLVKKDSSVTDEQFKQAVKDLQSVQPSHNVDANNLQANNASTITPTNSSDLKQLINTATVPENEAARGDAVDYLLTFDIGNQDDIKSLTISDNLEDVLDLKNVVIIDSDGNNVTNDGQLTMSQSDESFTWTAKDPAKYSGKKIYAAVATNIKKDADLSDYNGKEIPNVGHLIVNGKDYPTNQVKTKLNGNPKPDTENGNPDKNNPKDNNPITGKNGILPQTGRFIMKHIGAFVTLLVAAIAGVGAWLYKKNKQDKVTK